MQQRINNAKNGATLYQEETLTASETDGPLVIPAGKKLTLRLLDCELDRGLTAPRADGSVLSVLGDLTVSGSGVIRSASAKAMARLARLILAVKNTVSNVILPSRKERRAALLFQFQHGVVIVDAVIADRVLHRLIKIKRFALRALEFLHKGPDSFEYLEQGIAAGRSLNIGLITFKYAANE